MKENIMDPLPRIEDYLRRPSFTPVNLGERYNQTDFVFARGARGEFGENEKKIMPFTPPPHPMDRTVFSPNTILSLLREGCEANVFKWKVPVLDKKKMSLHIKQAAKELGADLVGITYLHPTFVFKTDYFGNPIDLNHKYAIVIAKEMSYEHIATSPSWYDHVEVAKTYQKVGIPAVHLAHYIGQLGYPATASMVTNDKVFHVPLAVYAGLGEYSRMGRVITKKYGPRVRLATVVTDLPLEVDHPIDLNVEHFCQICKKCAICCPAQSIPKGNQKVEIRGFLKWDENAEDCYRFWRKNPYEYQACTRCVAVCPWNKPNNLLHKFVSTLAVKITWMHKIILFFDDLLYGKKPKRKEQPSSYNDYLMKEDDYWQMLDDPEVNMPLKEAFNK